LGSVDRLVTAAPQIPIIVLCSMQDELVAKEAIQHGAQDYLLKEHLNNYLLPKTLTGVIERASITEALFDEKERAQVTLNSIGDAVISTDVEGRVSYMNSVAERLTGWPLKEALGRPLEEVFKIIKTTGLLAIKRAQRPDRFRGLVRRTRSFSLVASVR
jgi:PAS domain-containing protein